ncbi:MAG: peptidoglycan editing factor PgeF [Phycisphaerae bacterium]|nr:peptidoglycan editing factor PgeF [Phycisphaerae bacterium]
MPSDESTSYSYSNLSSNREVGRFTPLEKIPGLAHAVTTKNGPLFPADANAATELYVQLAAEIGCDDVAWTQQMHGNCVKVASCPGDQAQADGLVTDTPNLALLCRSADCPLILTADTQGSAVGIAHASWKGTVAKISERLIEAMIENFGCDPGDIVACVCPSAGPDKYEVGQDVYDAAIEKLGAAAKWFFVRDDGKYKFDLWAANTNQLQSAGLDFMNIYTARVCTITNCDRYPSYRAEGAAAKRFAAIIGRPAGKF